MPLNTDRNLLQQELEQLITSYNSTGVGTTIEQNLGSRSFTFLECDTPVFNQNSFTCLNWNHFIVGYQEDSLYFPKMHFSKIIVATPILKHSNGQEYQATVHRPFPIFKLITHKTIESFQTYLRYYFPFQEVGLTEIWHQAHVDSFLIHYHKQLVKAKAKEPFFYQIVNNFSNFTALTKLPCKTLFNNKNTAQLTKIFDIFVDWIRDCKFTCSRSSADVVKVAAAFYSFKIHCKAKRFQLLTAQEFVKLIDLISLIPDIDYAFESRRDVRKMRQDATNLMIRSFCTKWNLAQEQFQMSQMVTEGSLHEGLLVYCAFNNADNNCKTVTSVWGVNSRIKSSFKYFPVPASVEQLKPPQQAKKRENGNSNEGASKVQKISPNTSPSTNTEIKMRPAILRRKGKYEEEIDLHKQKNSEALSEIDIMFKQIEELQKTLDPDSPNYKITAAKIRELHSTIYVLQERIANNESLIKLAEDNIIQRKEQQKEDHLALCQQITQQQSKHQEFKAKRGLNSNSSDSTNESGSNQNLPKPGEGTTPCLECGGECILECSKKKDSPDIALAEEFTNTNPKINHDAKIVNPDSNKEKNQNYQSALISTESSEVDEHPASETVNPLTNKKLDQSKIVENNEQTPVDTINKNTIQETNTENSQTTDPTGNDQDVVMEENLQSIEEKNSNEQTPVDTINTNTIQEANTENSPTRDPIGSNQDAVTEENFKSIEEKKTNQPEEIDIISDTEEVTYQSPIRDVHPNELPLTLPLDNENSDYQLFPQNKNLPSLTVSPLQSLDATEQTGTFGGSWNRIDMTSITPQIPSTFKPKLYDESLEGTRLFVESYIYFLSYYKQQFNLQTSQYTWNPYFKDNLPQPDFIDAPCHLKPHSTEYFLQYREKGMILSPLSPYGFPIGLLAYNFKENTLYFYDFIPNRGDKDEKKFYNKLNTAAMAFIGHSGTGNHKKSNSGHPKWDIITRKMHGLTTIGTYLILVILVRCFYFENDEQQQSALKYCSNKYGHFWTDLFNLELSELKLKKFSEIQFPSL